MVDNPTIAPGYRTAYGGTLLQRREHDWLVLTAFSTPGNAGGAWALAALTSEHPDVNYSAPKLLLYPQSDRFHPHPCEFYPCFSDGDVAYCPCTSLQANRGYQAMYRSNLSTAEDPDSWELYVPPSLCLACGPPPMSRPGFDVVLAFGIAVPPLINFRVLF